MPYEDEDENEEFFEDEIPEFVDEDAEPPPLIQPEPYQLDDHGKDPCEEYFWREEDHGELASALMGKVEEFQDYTRTSTYFEWCRTAWNYYFKMAFGSDAVGLKALGEQGELIGAQINHYRNLLQHRLNLTTKDRPALICRARNSDTESQIQAEFGQGLVEHYMRDKRVEEYLVKTAEAAILFGEGFLLMTWDPNSGEIRDVEGEDFLYEGDIRFENLTSWNVIRDLGVRDWDKTDWIGIRRPANKWNLCANYAAHAEKIKTAQNWEDISEEEGVTTLQDYEYLVDTDQVEVLEFWHRACPAIPMGRYILMCGGAILQDEAWDYEKVPVERLADSELLLTPHAYSSSFDLIGVQELMNSAVSTIATNQNAFGVQSLWKKTGGILRITQVLGGMNLVESEEKPEPLQLTQTPAEVFTFFGELVRHGEIVGGIDQVTRGYTDANIRSGAMAALLQSQSIQFSSSLMRNYYQLLERIGTGIIKLIREFASPGRVITIVGKHKIPYTHKFIGGGEDLENIERVTVETTNPMFNTFAGKLEWATQIAKTGLVKNQEELLNTFRTGNADTMLEADRAQLNLVREENEALLLGVEIPDASPTEHHVLHIKEHAAVLGSLEAKTDVELVSRVLAHNMGHLTLLMSDPNTQLLQTTLGYQTPFPPGAAAAGTGAPPGEPPQAGGSPGEEVSPPQPMNPSLDGRSTPQMPSPSTA